MLKHVFALCLSCAPVLAAAETRAVLVGVGDYLYLDADLEGPVNDIGLMAQTLMRRGVAAGAITALADEAAPVPAGVSRGLPDRDAILGALEGAIAASGQGDSVLFYFSGHGAQMPDASGDEGGGMDEIFLPRDAKGWNGAAGKVENAIVDDEFALLTEAAAARGVSLIAIIDACHSGTGFRALPGAEARARYISPAELGVPEADDGGAGPAEAPPGEYVFLYAAQSDQRAFEYPLGEERVWHGDFTRALTEVMNEVPDLSWTQLVTAASSRMRQVNGQAAQTPDVEGPLAEAPVLGGDAPGLNRLEVDGQTLRADLLRGVTEGSEITLYAGLLDAEPSGLARVTAVRANEADIEYLEPFPTLRVTHGAITQRAVDTSVRLGPMPEGWAYWLDIPVDDADPTHRVVAHGDGYALTGPDGVVDALGEGTSLRLLGVDAESYAQTLTNAVSRLRLERALAQMGQGGGAGAFTLPGAGPKVSFTVEDGRPRGNRCTRANADGEVSVDGQADTSHCDILRVTFENPTASMQDVTILYINADHSIDTVWPPRNLSNRIESTGSQTMTFALSADDDRPVTEALLVIAVPAKPGSMRTTLNILGGATVANATSEMSRYLSGITDPAATRGFSLTPKAASLSVTRLDLAMTPQDLSGDQ